MCVFVRERKREMGGHRGELRGRREGEQPLLCREEQAGWRQEEAT